ncbi:AMIN-like domain-containing (lipo)protein [Streptomyces aureus]
MNHPSLRGCALTGGYEGEYGFGLALDDYSSYRVFTLTSPNRVVVDVHH